MQHIFLSVISLLLFGITPLQARETASTAPVASKSLGRLFHPPSVRVELEKAHRHNDPTPHRAFIGHISLDGIIRRGKGPATIWINGRIQEDENLIVLADTHTVRLTLEPGKTHDIKVGESIEFSQASHTP